MMTEPDGTTRCVVLGAGPHHEAIAPPLADKLAARRWCGASVADPLAALAELCLLERAGNVRRPWGQEPQQAPVLILTEAVAAPQPVLDQMLSALQRYLPRVEVWTFAGGELHPHAMEHDTASREPGPDGGEARRLADDSIAAEITREEISMLLDVTEEGEAS
jgi:hypothetical protein